MIMCSINCVNNKYGVAVRSWRFYYMQINVAEIVTYGPSALNHYISALTVCLMGHGTLSNIEIVIFNWDSSRMRSYIDGKVQLVYNYRNIGQAIILINDN